MKIPIHRRITQEAIKLLPIKAQEFFDQEFDGRTALEWITEGSAIEDTTIGPLGTPISQHSEDEIVSGDLPEIFLNEYQEGHLPWVEHFWNDDFGFLGLKDIAYSNLKYRSAFERAKDYWDSHIRQYWEGEEKGLALTNFGRIVHLLEDMGVPAHVHGDIHPCLSGWIDDDDFEEYTNQQLTDDSFPWSADPNTQKVFYHPRWGLFSYFRYLAGITVLYDSDDVDGQGQGIPYRWDDISDSYDIHRDANLDLTDYACHQIANDLFPVIYGFVSGLYLWFLQEINWDFGNLYLAEVKLEKIKVFNDQDTFGPGEIYLDLSASNFHQQLGGYSLKDGQSKSLSYLLPSQSLQENDDFMIEIKIYDNDSWWAQPHARDSLGKISLRLSPSDWLDQLGEWQSQTIQSSSDDCEIKIKFKISCSSPFEESTQETEVAPQTESNYDEEENPSCILNGQSFVLHRSSCGIGLRIKEEHKINLSAFPEEVTVEFLEAAKSRKTVLGWFDPHKKEVRCCRCCFGSD